MSSVFVGIQSVLGIFALFEIDAKFDKEEHDRFDGGNRIVAGSLGDDMLVE